MTFAQEILGVGINMCVVNCFPSGVAQANTHAGEASI